MVASLKVGVVCGGGLHGGVRASDGESGSEYPNVCLLAEKFLQFHSTNTHARATAASVGVCVCVSIGAANPTTVHTQTHIGVLLDQNYYFAFLFSSISTFSSFSSSSSFSSALLCDPHAPSGLSSLCPHQPLTFLFSFLLLISHRTSHLI